MAEPVTSAEPAAPAPPIAAVFTIEETDLEPVPLASRRGRAARMFWLWFAATSSLVSVGVGATLFTLGLSLRQMLVAALVGVALSFLPLGLGTLAGKWSGQPTMVVSRATFGLRGNVVPAALALLTRLFWGAVLLWLVGSAVGTLAHVARLARSSRCRRRRQGSSSSSPSPASSPTSATPSWPASSSS